MNQKETIEKTNTYLQEYFNVSEIDLRIELIEKEVAIEKDFKSKFEINVESENQDRD